MRRSNALLAGRVACLVVAGISLSAAGQTSETAPADRRDRYVEIPLGRDALPPRSLSSSSSSSSSSSAPPPAATAPSPEIEALVRQLGDADFRAREIAAAKLKEAGPAAMPALKAARDAATDPEVASRAEAVVRHVERPPVPRGSLGDGADLGGDHVVMRQSVRNGVHRAEVREPSGRVVRIDEGPAGIRMSVTGTENGEPVTRDFEARTPEQLRQQNPEAFELYQRWTGRNNAFRLHRGGRGGVPPARLRGGGGGNAAERFRGQVGPRLLPADEMVDELLDQQARLRQQLRAARGDAAVNERGLLEEVRRQQRAAAEVNVDDAVADAMELLERIQAPDADMRGRAAAMQKWVDDLQREAMDQAFADPAGDLRGVVPAPPTDARLDVMVLDDDAFPNPADPAPPVAGVTIVRAMPGGRADRMGLRPGDVIRSINGQPVTDPASLRRVLTAAKPPLAIEATRDGKPLKVQEEKPKVEPPAAAVP